MRWTEANNYIDEAWCEFFSYLRDKGFDVAKMEKNMDYKDVFSAVQDAAVFPEGGYDYE